jgi:hypothetical protein
MAGYKAHLATGLLIGVIATISAFVVLAIDILFSPFIFLAIVIGSFLPDLDSDTGMPVKMLFASLGMVTAIWAGYLMLERVGDEPYKSIATIMGAYCAVYIILQRIFKRFTKHRGLFHSILALLIAMLTLNYLLLIFEFSLVESGLLSVSLGVGYLGHLILDEINSVVNLSGIPFIPNKSLGSALKIVSKSKHVNVIAFTILSILFIMTYFQTAT